MNGLKKVLNVLGILVAIPLSLILAVVLVITPVVSAASSFMQAETLHKVFEKIDYEEVIMSNDDLADMLESSGVDSELIETVMKTDMMEEVIDLYANNLFAVLEGEESAGSLTEKEINDIIQNHVDELVDIVKSSIDEEVSVPDEEIRDAVSQMLEGFSGNIAEMLPKQEDLGLDAEVMQAIKDLRSGKILWSVIGVAAVISLLIVLCRFVRFQGFLWLGIVYFCSAALSLAVAFGAGEVGSDALADAGATALMVAEPILSVLSAELMKGAGVLAGLAVVFIAIFVIARKLLKKKMAVQEPTFEELSM